MKRWITGIMAVLVVALGATLWAADTKDKAAGSGEQPREGRRGQGEGRRRPPMGPLMKALDTDGNGELSAEEIASAPAALKKLDKNSDGKLDRDELRPPRPPRPEGDRDEDDRPPRSGRGGHRGPHDGGQGGDDEDAPPPPPPGE